MRSHDHVSTPRIECGCEYAVPQQTYSGTTIWLVVGFVSVRMTWPNDPAFIRGFSCVCKIPLLPRVLLECHEYDNAVIRHRSPDTGNSPSYSAVPAVRRAFLGLIRQYKGGEHSMDDASGTIATPLLVLAIAAHTALSPLVASLYPWEPLAAGLGLAGWGWLVLRWRTSKQLFHQPPSEL